MTARKTTVKPAAAAVPVQRAPSPARAEAVASAEGIAGKLAATVGDELSAARTFSSGSTGFYAGYKITVGGARFQVGCNVILIGSKATGDAPTATRDQVTAKLGGWLKANADSHDYKSGAGVYAGGKFRVGDDGYQVGCNVTPIAGK